MEKQNTVLKFNEMTRKNIPYVFIWIVYYAWIIAFTTWWTASAQTDRIVGPDMRALLHSVTLISSAIFISFYKKEWFVKLARIGAVLTVISMTTFLFVKNPAINLACALISGVSFALVNDSILMPFLFALNNSEKLFAAVASNALIPILTLTQMKLGSNAAVMGVSYVVLVASLVAVLFFREDAVSRFNKPEKTPPSRIYLTVLFSGIFVVLSKGIGKGLMNIADTDGALELWYTAASFAGALVSVLIFKLFDNSLLFSWNFSFACLAVGMMFNAFSDEIPWLGKVFASLLGVGNTVGVICTYYTLGVVAKKYASMRYARRYVILISVCAVIGVVVGRIVNISNSSGMSIGTSIACTAVMVILLVLSPSLAKTFYSDPWVQDAQRSEVDWAERSTFEKYNLTSRELEVCKLLLGGNTLRQIAGELKISYPTVNTYCTSLYRKLNINSRTELLVMFKDYNG